MMNFENKTFNDHLQIQAKIALSFYPELETVPIEFRLTESGGNSVMKAQPKFNTLFKKNKHYIVFVSQNFKIEDKIFNTVNIPDNVLIGWLGHELGHIMDYQTRGGFNLIGFGIKYLLSARFIRKAELTADRFAVNHGLQDYILATKEYILNHSDLSDRYKAKIKRLYASPEQILQFIEERAAHN